MAGCAALFSGETDYVAITSVPNGASVIIDNRIVAHTPATVALRRASFKGPILVYAPGFQVAGFERVRETNGWFIADIVSGLLGSLSVLVDIYTNNYFKLDDRAIHVDLIPVGVQHKHPVRTL